ncbi:MAG: AMP-binding protein, partial [Mycobacteriales bacterium]
MALMSTTTDDLHKSAFMPNLLVAALARHADKPAVYLGDEVLTASQVAAQMSKYVQAFASLGIAEHHPIAILSKNRPEVLFTMGANMLTPCRSTSLHPMGSADDQAYVLEDAELETLVFDPSAFEERAAELRDRVPGLKT